MSHTRSETYGDIWNSAARTRSQDARIVARTLADVMRLFRAGQCAECGAMSTDGISLYSHGTRFVQHDNGALVYSTEYYPRSWYWHGGMKTNIVASNMRGDTLRRHMRLIRQEFGTLPIYGHTQEEKN